MPIGRSELSKISSSRFSNKCPEQLLERLGHDCHYISASLIGLILEKTAGKVRFVASSLRVCHWVFLAALLRRCRASSITSGAYRIHRYCVQIVSKLRYLKEISFT